MQRVPVWRILIIVVVLLLSLWWLWPSYQFYSIDPYYRNLGITPRMEEIQEETQQQDVTLTDYQEEYLGERDYFRWLRENAFRLGMDLQGGVHLVIEVDQPELRQQLIQQNPEMDEEEIDYQMELALLSAAEVIQNRVDQFGVAEANIVRQPPNRIIVEMPGYSDPEAVSDLVQAEAQLSFHIVLDDVRMRDLIGDIDAVAGEDFQSLLLPNLPMPGSAVVAVAAPDNVELVNQILGREEIQSLLPRDAIIAWGAVEEPNAAYNTPYRFLYLLQQKPEVTGARLETASLYMDPMTNQPEVSITFDEDGAELFRRSTEQNVGENLAILMDDTVFSAPRINDPIRNGQARITGINNFDEARQIAVVLRAGALPAPLEIAESRVVGPALGADSIRSSVIAGLSGAAIVLIFMIFYYALCGVVANVAVILNVVLLMAALAMFDATLTLPGIAGIILTIGMAVDANVLIYDRLREEVHGKRAKTVPLLLEKGYGRAFMTIFDANITTLITALVLFQFGTGPIKGFAVTLSLGILISLFTAVFVTRTILDSMAAKGMSTLSIGKIWLFEKADYDFFKRFKVFMFTSVAIGLIGTIALVATWERHQGIDFKGGMELWAEFNEPVSVQDVREGLASAGMADSVIQEVLGEENQILIRVRTGIAPDLAALENMVDQALTPEFTVLQSDQVSEKVGTELLWRALYCLFFASIGILIYITARFEFRFAVAAVAALFHDLFFTLGALWLVGTEFNLPIIAALLTVLGYSLNDTIVVFDRIRENYTSAVQNFQEVVNTSINQTLSRTVVTGLTTLFVLITMFFFGGAVIHDFTFTMIVGVVIGTFSSIFIASPILVMMGGKQPEPANVREERRRRERERKEKEFGEEFKPAP